MYTITLKNGTRLEKNEISIKEILSKDDLAMFFLHIGERVIAVDFETGLFYIGGQPVNPDYAMEDHNYRIIYYKRSRIERGFGNKGKEQYIYAYLLGWQFTENGKNTQRIMFWYPETNIIEIKRKR